MRLGLITVSLGFAVATGTAGLAGAAGSAAKPQSSPVTAAPKATSAAPAAANPRAGEGPTAGNLLAIRWYMASIEKQALADVGARVADEAILKVLAETLHKLEGMGVHIESCWDGWKPCGPSGECMAPSACP